jgi:glutamate N-acetyltransferase / amino-acid N-acetyltransferase
MNTKISPLAPKGFPSLPIIANTRLGSIEAGIKHRDRRDLLAIIFDSPARIAGVFTQSRCPSAPVEWCREHLSNGIVRCIVVNSGNANAFTGMRGYESVRLTARAAVDAFGCEPEEVFIASTGVIGEPLDVSAFAECLKLLASTASTDGWGDAAQAIMTTDTYPKMASHAFSCNGQAYTINGIAKGAGMIAPDMATMLSFLVTDLPIAAPVLQELLAKTVQGSFNAITVDSDTSTSDTLLLASCGEGREIVDHDDPCLAEFRNALEAVTHELAMMVVRDGEGATKHIEITVSGAESDESARKIAFSIANSPLVKTAIAGEDANWGRIVMAVGKAGEPADRDRMAIHFGNLRVAFQGERDPGYSESAVSQIMKRDYIPVSVDVGIGSGKATVWTCDLTKEYVAINGDYRS